MPNGLAEEKSMGAEEANSPCRKTVFTDLSSSAIKSAFARKRGHTIFYVLYIHLLDTSGTSCQGVSASRRRRLVCHASIILLTPFSAIDEK